MRPRIFRNRRLFTVIFPALMLASSLLATQPARGQSVENSSPSGMQENAANSNAPISHWAPSLLPTIIQTQLLQPPPSAGGLDDEVYFQIDIEPPSRMELFSVGSENDFLQDIEDTFKSTAPDQIFLLPGAVDYFGGPDSPTLGPNWYQNRLTGKGTVPLSDHRGEMHVFGKRGVHDVGDQPEAAIISETVGSGDLVVSVDVALGGSGSEFGLIVRALDPNRQLDVGDQLIEGIEQPVDQIERNSYYYATSSSKEIIFGKMVNGLKTVLSTAPVAPAMSFNLSVLTYGDEVVVFRDDVEVLRFSDNSVIDQETGKFGEHVGVIAFSSRGMATEFDNFIAMRYGGPFEERIFALSDGLYHSPGVEYHPLYFEQIGLERFGHSCGNLIQPFIAQGMFFVDCIALPYSMVKSPYYEYQTGECYPQPGDIVLPYRLLLPVWDTWGVSQEILFWGLAFALLP